MSDPEKTATPARGPRPPPGASPIDVKELWFDERRDVPLDESARDGGLRQIMAGVRNTDERTEIQYEPWTRMYRVRRFVNDKLHVEFSMPESWACYVPET